MNNIDPGDTSGDVLAILQEQLESRNKTTVVVESTVLIIFNIVALIGNAILCFIPYGNPKLRSSTTMLIVALACTDLLTTANVMPLTIDAVINSRRRFSDVCLFVFVWFVCLFVFSLEDKYRPATKTFHFDRPSAYFPRCHESWVTHLLRKGGGGEIWFLQLLTMHPILVIPFQSEGGGEVGFYNLASCTQSLSNLAETKHGG